MDVTAPVAITPEALFAAALGFSALIADDHALLRHAFPLYDALYLWCRDLQAEAHRWQPAG